jgi:crotonobetainyl-CoA:carnitine CoA-transferase CaiB-like acyl-CoA transferase
VQHRAELYPRLEALFRTRTVADWRARLEKARVPHAPVNDYAAVFANEQVLSRGMKVKVTDPTGKPVDLIGSPFHLTGAELPKPTFPPRLGEHTDAVLREVLGLDAERVKELRAGGVLG